MKIFPTVASIQDGLKVSVFGIGFENSSFVCKFGQYVSDPVLPLSSTLIECLTPKLETVPLNPLPFQVGLQLGFQNFYAPSELAFQFTDLEVFSLYPSLMPMSPFLLTVTGDFSSFQFPSCHLTCSRNFKVSCVLQTSSALKIFMPTIKEANCSVQIAFENRERQFRIPLALQKSLVFPTFTTIVPTILSPSMGRFITIYGNHFGREASMECVWGTKVSHNAIWISESCILCSAHIQTIGNHTLQIIQMDSNHILLTHFFGMSQWDDKVIILNARNEEIPESTILAKRIQPSIGPTQGHSLIRLISVGWESPAYVTFSHSSGFFDTQVLSSTVLECMTPAGRAGPVTVEVVSGRGNQSQVLFGKYLYKEPDLLLGVTPSVCPENGGIVITVAGEHFVAGADALCRFGSIVEEGVSVSNKLLVCRCPANRAGDVYLEVSSNGIDFSVNKIQFVYSSQTIIFSAFPSVVISSVQTIVHLHITPDAPAALYCYFGNWSVEAFPESSSRLSCESPVHAPGDIVLSIGGAERPFSTRVKFTFLEAPHITSLNPSMWPSSAVRTTIRIVGTGFDTAGASCMFGEEEKVAAIIRSSSVALCKSSVQGDTQGVEVKLFFDKMRYMTNGIKLHYYERPVMMKIIPSVVSHKDVKSVTIYGDSFASSG
eukprot:764035-Hanusia_phi.AAC.1